MSTIKIGQCELGLNYRPYFIADIAANHDGSLERAFNLIELAKESGADAAKFQNFKAKTIVSRNGFAVMGKQLSHQKNWDKSVFAVYDDASIPDEWSRELKKKCDSVGIEYMTSPYDLESVDVADKYSNCFKIGSGDITWIDIVTYIAQRNKPVLLATGASSMEDVVRAVDAIKKYNDKIVLMQCNTNYTASKDNFKYINLNVLKEYAKRYPDFILGLSDHTYGYETVLGAIALGARVIEKHFTDDNNRIGPDHKFSMNPASWQSMVNSSLNLFYSLGDGVKKIEENERETFVVQRRGMYFQENLKQGHVIVPADLYPLRPIKNSGIPPYMLSKLIGQKLANDVKSDTAVRWEDILL